jgi:hypothetical protein
MAAVKGSRQHRMIVVPHRPWYRAWVFSLCLVALAALSWLTYRYGLDEGMATRVEVVLERDQLRTALADNENRLALVRQEVADLKLGGQVDTRANEEVRQSIEALQTQIAELNEEIRFYKGVMVPNAEEKGLRIERLDVSNAAGQNQYRYSLMLTQVVDKHEYIQGGVVITLAGTQGDKVVSYTLNELNKDVAGDIRFRFRYFQNIDGEITVPDGFLPTQMLIVARPAGRGKAAIERAFDWQLREG